MKVLLRSIALVAGLALGAAVFPSCQKAGQKTGSQTYDLTVVVVDNASCPVPDAKVTLRIQDGVSGRTVPFEKRTDEAGKCTFTDLRLLQGKVMVSTDTSLPQSYPFEFNEWTDRVWEISWQEIPL